MAFDPKLADRVRNIAAEGHSLTEKKMFGGLAFMLSNKMCCGVLGDKLVARVGADQYKEALKKPYVRPMDFTGRPLKGYVYVLPQGIKTKRQLIHWVKICLDFTSTLKTGNRKEKRKTVSQIASMEEARTTPLSKLINFGPVTLREFQAMELKTFGQLEDLGWEEVCRKWVKHFPERLNVNAFIGVIATLEGISWTKISTSDKAKARNLVSRIKSELGLLVKPNRGFA